ncbi:hydantoinase B/oxoprolinase family protein [Fulvivirga sediminis]|uniref:Hydantoinase B/oxoprolinase family protein n=1 Tax=Fulvivirga sediminis TaxID=2803949 RepID=A0A937JXR9_9BACT|nr:hydantoinase B/oxoprolinase family protein [Fulvivirga sediminis]MBL3654909.1 hydantoinase B/oxoprolinase family protein [Fulvivirga sediminis]
MWQICIDTGGTFTDSIAISPDGKTSRLKILSSSRLKGKVLEQTSPNSFRGDFNWSIDTDIFKNYHFSQPNSNQTALIESINFKENIIYLNQEIDILPNDFAITSNEEVPVLAARILTATELDATFPAIDMRLGSTKGTNALLERKGASVVFITTKGFKDLINIGTQQRPDIFALNIIKPTPLYKEVIEISERIDKYGNVLTAITNSELEKFSENLSHLPEDTSFAIAFMNSYKNPDHELKIQQLIKSKGFQFISTSSNISQNIKILSRAETTIANSYLQPVIENYISGITNKLINCHLRIMTSAGAIVNSSHFTPKDSLLSGPAGGIVGAKTIAEKSGYDQIITFDMGGTSTDVAIYDKKYDYKYETQVGDANILSPSLAIETIAAGGGSICYIKNDIMQVGPESAGSSPGPACYGDGGPVSITDLNLLCGRLVDSNFSIPLNTDKARIALSQITNPTDENLLAFLQIANEKMAEAIKKVSVRKGYSPADYALVTYGGAGGQHACAIADLLNIKTIIVPYDAGLLSAYGISQADIEYFTEKQILQPFDKAIDTLEDTWNQLKSQATQKLIDQGFSQTEIFTKSQLLYLRYAGQENTVEIDATSTQDYKQAFKEKYKSIYGHWLSNRDIELESAKIIAAITPPQETSSYNSAEKHSPKAQGTQSCLTKKGRKEVNFYIWERMHSGAEITGPAVITSNNCTLFIEQGWHFELDVHNHAVIKKVENDDSITLKPETEKANLELFKNRYAGIVEKMGSQLERTSFSVNIKERLDFSCALLDDQGYLIVNAPHIPVHLGSMGICVRKVIQHLPMEEGDIIITNHPAYGGSHLPDITLITGVFVDEKLVGYLASRAHHAEIGGKTPGSMPTDASTLEEEGVIIQPQYLAKNGQYLWEDITNVFQSARFPTRSIQENIADLHGGVASLKTGVNELQKLCTQYGVSTIKNYMQLLKEYVNNKLWNSLTDKAGRTFEATEYLDDQSKLNCTIAFETESAIFDFTGTSATHPGNLNATEAIVNSVVLYVLRLCMSENLPLNEGLISNIQVVLPNCLLNPDFSKESPAVVGGNTEISQRLTDTLLKALNMAACSQGTMNNVLFGNDQFGYYETIGGGTGAGEGFHGKDAVHQHMTNTKITDPEIMEYRYPVRINKFEIRKNSGGKGRWNGGNGIIREIEFLEKLNLTVLTQHRKTAPYGLEGGHSGQTGKQELRQHAQVKKLLPSDSVKVKPGDILSMYTPGGGGYGQSF